MTLWSHPFAAWVTALAALAWPSCGAQLDVALQKCAPSIVTNFLDFDGVALMPISF